MTGNYTLWVRSADDNISDSRFTVEVDGTNSTAEFADHNTVNDTIDFDWENGGEFELTASSTSAITIKVHDLNQSEITESCDVILLTTDPVIDPNDYPPVGKMNDTLIVTTQTGENLEVDLDLEFQNLNFTFSRTDLARNKTTQMTFNFTNGDWLEFRFGDVSVDNKARKSSMRVNYNNSNCCKQAPLVSRVRFLL